MEIRDILLQLTTYPEPTPDWAIEAAASVAEFFGAQLSAALCQVQLPAVSNILADKLVGANEAIALENKKSRENGEHLLSRFGEIVSPQHLGDQFLVECMSMVTSLRLAGRARVADMTIVPSYGYSQTLAEDLVFDSGRAVLLLPIRDDSTKVRFDEVVIGWDGGRAAARALADALPICARAKSVRIVTVTGEKPLEPQMKAALDRHLRIHDIEAEITEEPAAGCDAGSVLLQFCRNLGAELLVMGAFGHSRFREFVLGGATRTVLAEADLPILLSH